MSRKFNKLVVLSVVVSMMLSFSIPATALPVSEAVSATTTVAPVAPVQPAAPVAVQAAVPLVEGVVDVAADGPVALPQGEVKHGVATFVVELADEPTAVVDVCLTLAAGPRRKRPTRAQIAQD